MYQIRGVFLWSYLGLVMIGGKVHAAHFDIRDELLLYDSELDCLLPNDEKTHQIFFLPLSPYLDKGYVLELKSNTEIGLYAEKYLLKSFSNYRLSLDLDSLVDLYSDLNLLRIFAVRQITANEIKVRIRHETSVKSKKLNGDLRNTDNENLESIMAISLLLVSLVFLRYRYSEVVISNLSFSSPLGRSKSLQSEVNSKVFDAGNMFFSVDPLNVYGV